MGGHSARLPGRNVTDVEKLGISQELARKLEAIITLLVTGVAELSEANKVASAEARLGQFKSCLRVYRATNDEMLATLAAALVT